MYPVPTSPAGSAAAYMVPPNTPASPRLRLRVRFVDSVNTPPRHHHHNNNNSGYSYSSKTSMAYRDIQQERAIALAACDGEKYNNNDSDNHGSALAKAVIRNALIHSVHAVFDHHHKAAAGAGAGAGAGAEGDTGGGAQSKHQPQAAIVRFPRMITTPETDVSVARGGSLPLPIRPRQQQQQQQQPGHGSQSTQMQMQTSGIHQDASRPMLQDIGLGERDGQDQYPWMPGPSPEASSESSEDY